MPERPQQEPTRLKFFGRRKGRPLKQSQEQLLSQRLPALSISPEDSAWTSGDSGRLIGRPATALWFEVGFGSGEHLVWQAREHPHVCIVGCEPFLNGVAKLIRDVDMHGLDNVRVLADDARPLLDALPDGAIDRFFLLFPDPWPKKRHWNRRFLGPANLPLLARVLKDGAELRLASDHPGYQDWMMRHLFRHPDFEWLDEGPRDWRVRKADWPSTRYEEKALAGTPVYLRFRRRPRSHDNRPHEQGQKA